MKAITVVINITLLLLIGGCAEFKYPLTPVSSSQADPELDGIWQVDRMTTLYIGSRDKHSHTVVIVSRAGMRGLTVNEGIIYPTAIQSQRFFSVPIPGKSTPKAWLIFKYGVNNGELQLALPDHNLLRSDIVAKNIAGRILDVPCDFKIDLKPYAKDLKDAGQGMGILALSSFIRTMCRERMQIPVVTAKETALASYLMESSLQHSFIRLDSPRQLVSWQQ